MAFTATILKLIGVIICLLLSYLILKYVWYALKNVRNGLRGLTNGAKLILVIILILGLFQVYSIHPNISESNDNVTNFLKGMYNSSLVIENIIQNTQKPLYSCNTGLDAASYIVSCEESKVILDEESITYEIDIVPIGSGSLPCSKYQSGHTVVTTCEKCKVTYKVTRCTYPPFEDKSMTCYGYSSNDLRGISKFIYDPDQSFFSDPFVCFKYCKGSLKDTIYEEIEKFAQMFFG